MRRRIKRVLLRLFHLPDWGGYLDDREEWFIRERLYGMTPEEEAKYREKDRKFQEAMGMKPKK
jgi:hypothetical protein